MDVEKRESVFAVPATVRIIVCVCVCVCVRERQGWIQHVTITGGCNL